MEFYVITLKFFKVKTIKKIFHLKVKFIITTIKIFSPTYLIFKDRKVNVLKKFPISFTKFNSAPPTQPLPTFKFQCPLLSFQPKENPLISSQVLLRQGSTDQVPKRSWNLRLVGIKKNFKHKSERLRLANPPKVQKFFVQWRNLGFKDSYKDFSPPQ